MTKACCAGLSLLLFGCSEQAAPGGPATADVADAAAEGAQEQPAAVLTEVDGDVRVRLANTATWMEARPGLALSAFDTVQTIGQGRAVLQFRSGGRADLGPETTLRVPEQPQAARRLTHLKGFLVARLDEGSESRRMEVELPPGSLVLESPAGLAHTELIAEIDIDPNRTEVAMVKGHGTLARQSGDKVRIEEDHFVHMSAGGELLLKGRVSPKVVPLAPGDGAKITTWGPVRFRWAKVEGAHGVVVTVTSSKGSATSKQASDGAEALTLSLGTGDYTWTLAPLVGGQGGQPSSARKLRVEVDRSPPVLDLVQPAPGASISGPIVVVSGRTEPGATVRVDGAAVPVDGAGRFRSTRRVARGLVNIVVRATDTLGNTRTVSRAVVRQ